MVLGIEFNGAKVVGIDVSDAASSMILPLVRLTFKPEEGGYVEYEIDAENYGTAFCIAVLDGNQAIYLTAQHNITDLIDSTETNVAVMAPSSAGPEPFTFVPVSYWGIRDTHNDIAAFCLDLSDALGGPANPPEALNRWHIDELRPGQSCVAFGYGSPVKAPEGKVPGLYASQGTIEEIHPHQRDRAFVNFPSFLVAAQFSGGMSGGPVMTDDDRVIGVVSTGLNESTSYASLIQAALTIPIPFKKSDGKMGQLRMRDLIDSGAIDLGAARSKVSWGPSGLKVSWPDASATNESVATTIAEQIAETYGLPGHDL